MARLHVDGVVLVALTGQRVEIVHVGVHLTTADEKWLPINGHLQGTVLLVLVALSAAEGPAQPIMTVLVLVGGLVIALALVLTVHLVNVLVDKWHLSDHQWTLVRRHSVLAGTLYQYVAADLLRAHTWRFAVRLVIVDKITFVHVVIVILIL